MAATKSVKVKKPKKTARERGYVSREEGVRCLRAWANQLETTPQLDGRLVKIHISEWFTDDDEPAKTKAEPYLTCGPQCNHSDAEHGAFDNGLSAGEQGAEYEDNPFPESNPELREAWWTGHSVGLLNRGGEEE